MARGIGRHMPLEGHALRALETARAIGCDAIQIFVSSPRIWAAPAEKPTEIAALGVALREHGFAPIVIHAAYLLNLASANPETRTKSLTLLRWTLERGAAIGADAVVMHIGSHGGDGLEVGIERLVAGLTTVVRDLPPGPRLLLENDVGAGNTIGSRFDAMSETLARTRPIWGERIGVCLDTAHLWGAGYDIGTPAATAATLAAIDATVGLDQVGVIHLNDTVTKLGGHRDLHARLGEGIIGETGLRAFLCDPRLARAGVILETPIVTLPGSESNDWDDDRERIAYARLLVTESPISC